MFPFILHFQLFLFCFKAMGIYGKAIEEIVFFLCCIVDVDVVCVSVSFFFNLLMHNGIAKGIKLYHV